MSPKTDKKTKRRIEFQLEVSPSHKHIVITMKSRKPITFDDMHDIIDEIYARQKELEAGLN